MQCDVRATVRGSLPAVPFRALAHEVLGERYALSVVVCADALARKVHSAYRLPALRRGGARGEALRSGYAPNVLSFPLSKREGEIFLNVGKAAREAKILGLRTKDRLAHLFVHACLHLKGRSHGERMEKEEERVLAKFGYLKIEN